MHSGLARCCPTWWAMQSNLRRKAEKSAFPPISKMGKSSFPLVTQVPAFHPNISQKYSIGSGRPREANAREADWDYPSPKESSRPMGEGSGLKARSARVLPSLSRYPWLTIIFASARRKDRSDHAFTNEI